MKLVSYLSGIVGASLSVIGVLFKIMHWPFSGIILFSGMVIIALIAIPFIGYYNYSKN